MVMITALEVIKSSGLAATQAPASDRCPTLSEQQSFASALSTGFVCASDEKLADAGDGLSSGLVQGSLGRDVGICAVSVWRCRPAFRVRGKQRDRRKLQQSQ
jgi:hypothetical protein